MPAEARSGRRRRPLKPPYAGRHPNAVPTTLTLDREAKELLREMATGKTLGAFLSGLIYAEAARREERQRLRRLLADEPTEAGGAPAAD